MKPCLHVLAFMAVVALTLALPTLARALDGHLEGLRVIAILVEPLDKTAEGDQITKQLLEDQVLVAMRSKAPNLRVDSKADPYLYVNLTYLVTGPMTYAANLSVDLRRPVEVLVGADNPGQTPSKRIWTLAPVWEAGTIFTGSRSRASERVRSILDELLERFLAAYYRSNSQ